MLVCYSLNILNFYYFYECFIFVFLCMEFVLCENILIGWKNIIKGKFFFFIYFLCVILKKKKVYGI